MTGVPTAADADFLSRAGGEAVRAAWPDGAADLAGGGVFGAGVEAPGMTPRFDAGLTAA